LAGIVIIETITGKGPYSDMKLLPQQIMLKVIEENLRPTIPEDAPLPLRSLILDCLHSDPKKRPNFAEIKKRLKRIAP
jgi:serine/threonine protein kinase